ncbi:Na+/H+ antiporter NhaA [Robiginitalea sp. SC105]|nr:Na+/H+ antiporter NhaA [Robiginitalea sp. SC105]
MSIFIANLAFEEAAMLQQAKLATLIAFVLAVFLGVVIFRVFVREFEDGVGP